MATLRVTVLIGAGKKFADTAANRAMVVTLSPLSRRATTTNKLFRATPKKDMEYPVNLNNPFSAGTISVSTYSPVYIDTAGLLHNDELIAQMVQLVTENVISVTTQADASTPLTTTQIQAYGVTG